MPTYRMTLHTGMTGTSTRGRWTNVFHLAIANTIDSVDVATAALALANSLKHVLTDQVTIFSATVKDPTQDGHGYDPAKVRTVPLNVIGTKLQGGSQTEPKESVVRFSGACVSGRPAHFALRGALVVGEAKAGSEGDPAPQAAFAGADDVVTALNALIAGGTEFHAYSKLKHGGVSDRAVTAFALNGLGARTARRHRKRNGVGSKPQNWVSDAVNLLKEIGQLATTYTVAKTIVPALTAPSIEAAVPAIAAGAEELLPLLALL